MKYGIIFDMDGTIWDSAKQVVIAYNEYLEQCHDTNFVLTEELLKSQMGKTAEEISRVYFSDLSVERGLEIMNGFCKAEQKYLSAYGGTLYPQLEETLKYLAKNYSLYIVSNCQCGYIESFYKYHKLDKYFCGNLCHGDTGLSKGANIAKIVSDYKLDKAVYVGDTNGDFLACKEANVPFIYAAYGFGTVENPDYSINCFADLKQLIPLIFNA